MFGCNLLGSDPKKEIELAEFEGYFHAVVNGEPWVANEELIAAFTEMEDDSLLQFWGSQVDSLLFPYNSSIRFSQFYLRNGNSNYSVSDDTTKLIFTGARFSEKDGDAVIATYYPIEGPINNVELTLKKDGFDREYIEGTISMKTVTGEPGHNVQYRQQPDTVLISNGVFRILVYQRED